MKGTVTMDFMIFVTGMLIMIAIISMVFGSTVIGPVMAFVAPGNPTYLAEEYASFFSVISFAPGDMKMGIKPNIIKSIKLNSQGFGYGVSVMGKSTWETRYFITNDEISVNIMEGKLRTQSIMYAQRFSNELSLVEEIGQ